MNHRKPTWISQKPFQLETSTHDKLGWKSEKKLFLWREAGSHSHNPPVNHGSGKWVPAR